MQETWVQSLGWEDSLEKGRATHSSILTWRIPWTTDHGVTKSWTQLSDFHLEKHKAHSSTYFTVILWFCMKPFWFTCRDKGIEKTYVGRKVGYSSRTPAHPSRPSWNDICKEVSLDPWLAGILTKHLPRIIGVTCVCVCVCVCVLSHHTVCGTLVSQQGSNLCPLQWKYRVLTTEPPLKSQVPLFWVACLAYCCISRPSVVPDSQKKVNRYIFFSLILVIFEYTLSPLKLSEGCKYNLEHVCQKSIC